MSQHAGSSIEVDCIPDQQPRCELGEGLLVSHGQVVWLDIHASTLYLYRGGLTEHYRLPSQATVALLASGREILLGSSTGLFWYDTGTRSHRMHTDFAGAIDTHSHRTNDGVVLGSGDILIGTMHIETPQTEPGSIYHCKPNGDIRRLFDDVHIPNSFIEIAPGKVLVTDSFSGEIYCLACDDDNGDWTRSTWKTYAGPGTPDGGTMLPGGTVAFAVWDGACIAVFDGAGGSLGRVPLPVPRPTNLKCDEESDRLWITSAAEGLSSSLLSENPLSGYTFSIPLNALLRS